jgi:hypothetical protein
MSGKELLVLSVNHKTRSVGSTAVYRDPDPTAR